MTTIDHTAEAAKCEDSAIASRHSNDPDGGLMWATLAQAHHTAALVEQQRIANLIALATPTVIPVPEDYPVVVPLLGDVQTEPYWPDIAAALKIGDPS